MPIYVLLLAVEVTALLPSRVNIQMILAMVTANTIIRGPGRTGRGGDPRHTGRAG